MRRAGRTLATPPGHGRNRERTRWQARRIVLLAIAPIAAVVIATVVVLTDSENEPTSSAREPDLELVEPLAITDPPDSYRIVYRLDEFAKGSATPARTTTEEVIVSRPYSSRRMLWPGENTSMAPMRTSVSGFGFLSVRSAEGQDVTLEAAPAPGTGDLRLENTLAELVSRGRMRAQSQLVEVAGTQCQMFRTLEPIGAGVLAPPTRTEWTDICIDHRGLKLREDWYLGGRLFQQVVATEVDTEPVLAEDTFAPFSEPQAVAVGGGAVQPVDPTSRPDFTFWALDEPPDGFTHRGRFQVLTPSNQRSQLPNSPFAAPFSEVVDVYERGPDFIVISRGSFVGREGEFAPRDSATTVDLGELGTGELEAGVYGTWLRVKTDAVQFLSIRATAEPSMVVDIARRLQPQPRGRLVFLDPADAP